MTVEAVGFPEGIEVLEARVGAGGGRLEHEGCKRQQRCKEQAGVRGQPGPGEVGVLGGHVEIL
jgi:hypothetical protein